MFWFGVGYSSLYYLFLVYLVCYFLYTGSFLIVLLAFQNNRLCVSIFNCICCDIVDFRFIFMLFFVKHFRFFFCFYGIKNLFFELD
ncbi:unnamed protein product [Onchocerca ochengi]|uniref:Ovule protein n=1 Tax=Onchocerca ochengi TaxID=42157 RepID=A0A182EIZ2_ONCOC|nr:unnamed protein product [Onchocerca ochengi]